MTGDQEQVLWSIKPPNQITRIVTANYWAWQTHQQRARTCLSEFQRCFVFMFWHFCTCFPGPIIIGLLRCYTFWWRRCVRYPIPKWLLSTACARRLQKQSINFGRHGWIPLKTMYLNPQIKSYRFVYVWAQLEGGGLGGVQVFRDPPSRICPLPAH
jgi:hypothetical protein